MFKKRKIASEIPFSRDMLPHNRRQLWLDVVKLHYLDLITIGLVLFVFAMPLILNMLATDAYTAQLNSSLLNAAQEQYTAALDEVYAAQVTSAIVSIPLFAVFAIGLSGLLRICRQYGWGDVVTPARDFAVGIKQNIKQTVCLAIIAGAVYASCVYLDSLANINPASNMQYVSSAWTMIAVLFLFPIGAYMLVCIAVYNNTFWQNFLQGFVLYMRAPLKTLWGLICFGGLLLLLMIPNTVVHFALTVVMILGAPFLMLGWFLYAFHQLDKFINSEKHPDLVNKGLYIDMEE